MAYVPERQPSLKEYEFKLDERNTELPFSNALYKASATRTEKCQIEKYNQFRTELYTKPTWIPELSKLEQLSKAHLASLKIKSIHYTFYLYYIRALIFMFNNGEISPPKTTYIPEPKKSTKIPPNMSISELRFHRLKNKK